MGVHGVMVSTGVCQTLSDGSSPSGRSTTAICAICRRELPRAAFHSRKERKGNPPYPYCKECRKQVDAARLQASNERIAVLKDEPCMDCGVKYPPWVMQFDHLRDKVNSVSKMKLLRHETIVAEIEKCDLVCANCHADRSYKRQNPSLAKSGLTRTPAKRLFGGSNPPRWSRL